MSFVVFGFVCTDFHAVPIIRFFPPTQTQFLSLLFYTLTNFNNFIKLNAFFHVIGNGDDDEGVFIFNSAHTHTHTLTLAQIQLWARTKKHVKPRDNGGEFVKYLPSCYLFAFSFNRTVVFLTWKLCQKRWRWQYNSKKVYGRVFWFC